MLASFFVTASGFTLHWKLIHMGHLLVVHPGSEQSTGLTVSCRNIVTDQQLRDQLNRFDLIVKCKVSLQITACQSETASK